MENGVPIKPPAHQFTTVLNLSPWTTIWIDWLIGYVTSSVRSRLFTSSWVIPWINSMTVCSWHPFIPPAAAFLLFHHYFYCFISIFSSFLCRFSSSLYFELLSESIKPEDFSSNHHFFWPWNASDQVRRRGRRSSKSMLFSAIFDVNN